MTQLPPKHPCNSSDTPHSCNTPPTREGRVAPRYCQNCYHCHCYLIAAIATCCSMESSIAIITIGTTFPSITEGKKAILEYVVERGESYRVQKADKRCWLAVCKDANCPFRIRLSRSNDVDE